MNNEVAEARKQRELVLDLPQLGVVALSDLLAKASPKGRVELRLHNRLFQVVNMCRDFVDETTFNWRASKMTYVDAEEIAYLIKILDERIGSGVPGALCEMYAYMLDAVDAHRNK